MQAGSFNKTGREQACNRPVEESDFIKALSLYNEWQWRKQWQSLWFSFLAPGCKARFPLGNKWQYMAIILKTSVISFTYIESEFWSSFDIMSDSEGKDILFLQLVDLFKMKKKKRRKTKIWVQELFHKYASGLWMSEKTYFVELKYN